MFSGCGSLSSILLPNSITTIGSNAFYSCSSLTGITIPNNVTSIGEYAFCGCSELATINIPNGVVSVEPRLFYGCGKLGTITVPNSVTSIGNQAFWGCNSLTTAYLGENIRNIGDQAFYNCTELTSIYNYRRTPCKASDNAFEEVDKFACTLYVPTGSEDMYRAATAWKDFFTIQGFEGQLAIDNILSELAIQELLANPATQVFTLQGYNVTAQRENLPAGTYILRLGNKAIKTSINK